MSKKDKAPVNNMTVQLTMDPDVLKMLLDKISELEQRIQMLELVRGGILTDRDHMGNPK